MHLTKLSQIRQTFSILLFGAITAFSFTHISGKGTPESPYLISSPEGLYELRSDYNSGSYFELTKSIDLQTFIDTSYNLRDSGWLPIGMSLQFGGYLNGKGYTISGLWINRPNTDGIGLFAKIGNGIIENLSIELSPKGIVGKSSVGILAGTNSAVIKNCYTSGKISGTARAVGGITGSNYETVENCYSTAIVTGIDSTQGGIVGVNRDGMVNSSYFLKDGGSNASINGIGYDSLGSKGSVALGKTANELQIAETFAGWDFSTLWQINPTIANGFPSFSYKNVSALFAGGTGIEADPFMIKTAEQLQRINRVAHYPNYYYALGNSIDLTEYLSPGKQGHNNGKGWQPIGRSLSPFGGNFNGKGFEITGFWINRPAENYIGLFGKIASPDNKSRYAFIDSIAVIIASNDSIKGQENVGAICGSSNANIRYCSVSGIVRGTKNNIGGIVGLSEGAVEYCSANVSVYGNGQIGGIAGAATSIIRNCYSSGSIGASWGDNAGIVGMVAKGFVSNCYSKANVVDRLGYGPIIGSGGTSKPIENCYFLKEGTINPKYNSFAGCIAKTSAELRVKENFNQWDFNSIWSIESDKNDGMPTLKPKSLALAFDEGAGTAESPYIIRTAEQLQRATLFSEISNVHLKLGNSIDLKSYLDTNSRGWQPIFGLKGVFDGAGYTISGMRMNRPNANRCGLFESIGNSGVVKNIALEIEPSDSLFGGLRTGGIVAEIDGGVVENCSVKGTISSGKYNLGGISSVS